MTAAVSGGRNKLKMGSAGRYYGAYLVYDRESASSWLQSALKLARPTSPLHVQNPRERELTILFIQRSLGRYWRGRGREERGFYYSFSHFEIYGPIKGSFFSPPPLPSPLALLLSSISLQAGGDFFLNILPGSSFFYIYIL